MSFNTSRPYVLLAPANGGGFREIDHFPSRAAAERVAQREGYKRYQVLPSH